VRTDRSAPAGGRAAGRSRRYWILLSVMASVEFVKGALLVSVLPALTARTPGMSVLALGWAFALQFVGDNALRIPAGRWIDRFGYRAPLTLGLLLAAAGVAALAWGRSAILLMAGCFLLGAGTSPLWPCAASFASEKGGGGSAFSGVYLASFAGTGLGPAAMGWMMKDASLRGPFRLLFAVSAAAVLLAAALPGKDRGRTPAPAGAARAAGAAPRPASARAGEGAPAGAAGAIAYLAMFLMPFAIGLLTPVVTLYVREVLGWPPSMFTALLFFGGGTALVLLPAAGKFADRAGAAPFLLPGAAAAAAATALVPWTPPDARLFAVVGAAAAGYALLIPSWKQLLAGVVPGDRRGAVWGMYLAVEGSGFVVGPVAGGWLWEHAGPGAPFLASAAALAAFLLLCLPISLRRKVMVR